MDLLAFLAVVAFVVGFLVWAIERAPRAQWNLGLVGRRPRAFATGWLVVTAMPTLAGVLQPEGPVPPMVIMVVVAGAAIGLALSSLGSMLAASTPLFLLVGFQSFRIPLELVLHRWTEIGVAPPQMTWTGSNIDIIAGIVALLSVPVVRRWRAFGWIPTLVGLALLGNVIFIVARSVPGPFLTYADPITIPNRFPHIWIATVCVAGALAVHLITIRALLRPVGTESE